MNLIKIRDCLEQRKSIIFYKKGVYSCYQILKDEYNCIYFFEPLPLKLRLLEVLKKISSNKIPAKSTIPELVEMILKKIRNKIFIILFDQFERLTIRSAQIYHHLLKRANILFICNFNHQFSSQLYGFFKCFFFINREQYYQETGRDEIDITYTIYFILSILCFLIYLKTATSPSMASILIGASWFALIIFRTFIYAGGRL